MNIAKPNQAPFSNLILKAITITAATALCFSGYLAWVGITGSKVVGCDGSLFSCGHVLTSKWSTVIGVPVGVPAVGLYVLVLGAIVVTARASSERVRSFALTVLVTLSLTAALAAVWFIGLQVFTIGNLCPYCLVAHACGLVLAGLMIWRRPANTHYATPSISAVVAVTGLMLAQLISKPPETFVIETTAPNEVGVERAEIQSDLFEPPVDGDNVFEAPVAESESSQSQNVSQTSVTTEAAMLSNPLFSMLGVVMAPQQEVTDTTTPVVENKKAAVPVKQAAAVRRLIPVVGGKRSLDVQQWPVWGDPKATYIVAVMFDYTCSHCRNTHQSMKNASKELGNQFAAIALPVPLSKACNDAATNTDPQRAEACEIAKLAIAVWLSDRSKFSAYHDWLLLQERTLTDARARATELVGAESLDQELAKASQYIAKNVQLYKEAGAGTVPKIMLPTTTVVGEVTSGGTIAGLVRDNLKP